MLTVSKDDMGFYQGFTMGFENGYEVSVQFGRVNYCSNKYLARSNNHSLDSCNNCGGLGQIAYTNVNDKKCKLNLEVV